MFFDLLVMVLPKSETSKTDDTAPIIFTAPKEYAQTPDGTKVIRGVEFALGWSRYHIRQLELTDPTCLCLFEEVKSCAASVCVAVNPQTHGWSVAEGIVRGVSSLLELLGDNLSANIIAGEHSLVADVVSRVIARTLRLPREESSPLTVSKYTPKNMKAALVALHQTEVLTESVHFQSEVYLTVGSLFIRKRCVAISRVPDPSLERDVVAFLRYYDYLDRSDGEGPVTVLHNIFAMDPAEEDPIEGVKSRHPMLVMVRLGSDAVTVLIARRAVIGNPLWYLKTAILDVHAFLIQIPVQDMPLCVETPVHAPPFVVRTEAWGLDPSRSLQYVCCKNEKGAADLKGKGKDVDNSGWFAAAYNGCYRQYISFSTSGGTTVLASTTLEKVRE